MQGLLTLYSIKKELARLERNKERRHAREKQKGIFRPSEDRDTEDPNATPAPAEKATGTTRKCANCGRTGHIKTNKKYCSPLFYDPPNIDKGDSKARGTLRKLFLSFTTIPSHCADMRFTQALPIAQRHDES